MAENEAASVREIRELAGAMKELTALHAALYRTCGLVTFHGPMPGVIDPIGLRNPADRGMWLDVLSGKDSRRVQSPDGAPFLARGTRSVTGRLIGGNLSVLCSLIGTPWEPDWDGALLLLQVTVGEEQTIPEEPVVTTTTTTIKTTTTMTTAA